MIKRRNKGSSLTAAHPWWPGNNSPGGKVAFEGKKGFKIKPGV